MGGFHSYHVSRAVRGLSIATGFILVLFVTIGNNKSFAGPMEDGLRLIELAPEFRQWMTQDQIEELAMLRHEKGQCGGFFDVTETLQTTEALLLDGPSLFSSWETEEWFAAPRQPTQQQIITPLLPELSGQALHDNVKTLSTQFADRRNDTDNGAAAAKWVAETLRAYAGPRTDVVIDYFGHNFKQPSVIARILGSGKRATEKVVIGGHLDSINWDDWRTTRVAPGADDNASGTAVIMEIFRILAISGYRPDRTVEFMFYAGEEEGLLGSQDIANYYRHQKTSVAGVMQFDMTMKPSDETEITLIGDYTDPNLNEFVKILIDQYVGVKWSVGKCGYACSDHASWSRLGFKAAFPFESSVDDLNPMIHTSKDVLEGLSPNFGLHFAKLGLAFAVELGSGE